MFYKIRRWLLEQGFVLLDNTNSSYNNNTYAFGKDYIAVFITNAEYIDRLYCAVGIVPDEVTYFDYSNSIYVFYKV